MEKVKVINSSQELDFYLNGPAYSLVFYSSIKCKVCFTYIKLCRMISQPFSKLSEQYPTIYFLKVDIETLIHPSISNLSTVPHFIFLKNGLKLSEYSGSDIQTIEKTILNNLG
ncbi:hypothetical protein ACTFIU_009296 [Dictyostelium citrinum]